jgi:DNA topoisomerase II
LRSGVIDNVLTFAKLKAEQAMARTGGSKRARLTGIMKLDDANKAGTKDGHRCTLILTEGDSAKALTASGLSIVGRDLYGGYRGHGLINY